MPQTTFDVFRYQPDTSDEAYRQKYDLEHGEDLTLLDAILRLQNEQDGTLAVRYSCRSAICGSCACRADGKTVLACMSQVEDLKAQWRATISPDYVLIDSRTGHTDVGGICTRQLPDSVVVLFFPNDQNLRGIESVVRDIRNEALPPRRKEITVHLVAANVPDLDDEERILAYVRQAGSINNSQCRDLLTVGLHRACYLLRKLHRAGLLNRDHSRRSAQYRQGGTE